MNSSLVAQSIGLLATCLSVSSVLMRCDRRLRLVAATGQATWTAHFWLLGAPTTAVMCALTCTRQLSSVAAPGLSPALHRLLAWIFYAAFTLGTLWTWQGWRSLLPWACAMLANFAYSSLAGTSMRKALRGADALALANGGLVGSIGAMLTTSLAIVFNSLTIRKLEGQAAAPPRRAQVAATVATEAA